MQKITPCLWFDNQAEEAVNFYISVFTSVRGPGSEVNSKILKMSRYDDEASKASGQPSGSVMVINFLLDGVAFLALNGGPAFKFTEAISLSIDCASQEEVDAFWSKLTENGGEESLCGWLKDKYGLSWQVVPTVLTEMMDDPDPDKSKRVMKAMLQMKKIDISLLKQAYDGL
jgi:predicted 3-demethylubiquinone-9 3-methyltransferase (glyoxalase superfamily)